MNSNVKLGKLPPKIDRRTFKLRDYMKQIPLPPAPAEVSWITKVPVFPMHLNDRIGDCTIAAAAHMIEAWTFYASGSEILVPDAAVLKAYEDVSGYTPEDPNDPQTNPTDVGAFLLDVLNYWRKTGIGGHKIWAYTSINWLDSEEVQWAIQLFGAVYIGINLPVTAQGQNAWTVADGGIYTPDGIPGSWGGHCVNTAASSPITKTCATWGEKLKMSGNFWQDYVDEAYAVISTEWIERNGETPSGLNLAGLQDDLSRL